MGAAPSSLQRVYLTLGAVIGVICTGSVLLLGIGLSLAADRYQLVPLPADVYLLSHVPFAVHPAGGRGRSGVRAGDGARRGGRFPRARPRGWRRARRSGCRDDVSGMTAELAVRRGEPVEEPTRARPRLFASLESLVRPFPPASSPPSMGPSGVGKSTLLHLLGGIDRADSVGRGVRPVARRYDGEGARAVSQRTRSASSSSFTISSPSSPRRRTSRFPSASPARRRGRLPGTAAELLEGSGSPTPAPARCARSLGRRAAASRDRARPRPWPAAPPRGRTDRQPRRRFGGGGVRPAPLSPRRAGDDHRSRHSQPRSGEPL